MFPRQQYKVLTLRRVPNKVSTMLKLNLASRNIDFTNEEEVNLMAQSKAEKITSTDASDIAQLVTEIDTEQGKGVEALFYILSVIQDGGSAEEAITYCLTMIKPKKKGRKK